MLPPIAKKSCGKSALSVVTMKDARCILEYPPHWSNKGRNSGTYLISNWNSVWNVLPAVGRTQHSDLGSLPSVMFSFSHFIFQQSSIVIFICHLEILVYLVFVEASEIVSCGMLASAQFLFSVLLQCC